MHAGVKGWGAIRAFFVSPALCERFWMDLVMAHSTIESNFGGMFWPGQGARSVRWAFGGMSWDPS